MTLGQFIYKTVHHYADHGFYFYVFWELPEGRNLTKIDKRISERYQTNLSRKERWKLRSKGEVVVRYVRYDRRALLIATDGNRENSLFFQREQWSDLRINPIELWKYSIGVYQNKGELRLRKDAIQSAQVTLKKLALVPDESAQRYFNSLSPFTYPGIIRQKKRLVRGINQQRKKAGLEPLTVWQPSYRE